MFLTRATEFQATSKMVLAPEADHSVCETRGRLPGSQSLDRSLGASKKTLFYNVLYRMFMNVLVVIFISKTLRRHPAPQCGIYIYI